MYGAELGCTGQRRHCDLITSVTWTAVNGTNYINPSFRTVLPSKAILSEMLCAASLDYCPGLFEVLTSEAPPSSNWFKSLPSFVPQIIWGVNTFSS